MLLLPLLAKRFHISMRNFISHFSWQIYTKLPKQLGAPGFLKMRRQVPYMLIRHHHFHSLSLPRVTMKSVSWLTFVYKVELSAERPGNIRIFVVFVLTLSNQAARDHSQGTTEAKKKTPSFYAPPRTEIASASTYRRRQHYVHQKLLQFHGMIVARHGAKEENLFTWLHCALSSPSPLCLHLQRSCTVPIPLNRAHLPNPATMPLMKWHSLRYSSSVQSTCQHLDHLPIPHQTRTLSPLHKLAQMLCWQPWIHSSVFYAS